jgi:hypothetical protein
MEFRVVAAHRAALLLPVEHLRRAAHLQQQRLALHRPVAHRVVVVDGVAAVEAVDAVVPLLQSFCIARSS